MTAFLLGEEFAGLLAKKRRAGDGTQAALGRLLAECEEKSVRLQKRLEECDRELDQLSELDDPAAMDVSDAAPLVDNDEFSELLRLCKDAQTEVVRKQRQLHVALNRFGKSVDNTLYSDLRKGREKPVELNETLLLSAVAEFLCMRGSIDVVNKLQEERGVSLLPNTQRVHAELERLTSAIDCEKNLGPALEWAEKESKDLEFAIHRFRFLHLVDCAAGWKGDPGLALAYARAHFSTCGDERLPEVRRLMWNLFRSKSDAVSLRTEAELLEIRTLLVSEYRKRNRMPTEPPLLVATNVGALVLPARIRLASLMEVSSWKSDSAPPVDVVIPAKYKFHSVVLCPVSREQATPSNPAMALPCGHLLCKNSLRSVMRGGRRIKCPYCPTEATLADPVEVIF